MNDKNPDMRQLSYAITSLNDDAESMHSLITRSTDELERATAEGQRVAGLADRALEQLSPLTDEFRSAIENVNVLLSGTNAAIDKLTDDFERAQTAGKEEFESFKTASLKAAEKTRDDLQTDLLSHKTATAARLDSLEGEMTKRIDALEGEVSSLKESVAELEKSLNEKAALLEKKIAWPLYGVVVVAILQVVTLALHYVG